MRENDPRIGGRFWSVDPLTKKYPGLTPYQFASNSPISGIDEDGLEWAYYDKDKKQVDINSNTTNEDKTRIAGVRWAGYDTDKDGNKIPKAGTVKTAFTFGAAGMTISMTSSKGTPIQKWLAYEDLSTGNNTSDRYLSTLHPLVQNQMKSFILEAQFRYGIDLRATAGYRTVEQQDRLFAQGRTQPQIGAKERKLGITRTIIADPNSPVVTNAIGGYSNHNFGLAIDVTPFESGRLNWNTQNYPLIGVIGKSRDLEWGGNWNSIVDPPHFQDLQGRTEKQLRALPKDGNGLPIIH
jgi:hypothetical protein